MLSISSNSMSRSSLEQMLDLLQRRDENEKPKDLPPALPVRPKLTSRTRLPSAKRPLPTVIEGGEAEPLLSPSDCNVKKENLKGLLRNEPNSVVAKKVRGMDAGESPYVMVSTEKEEHESRLEEEDTTKLVNSSPGSLLGFRDFARNDGLEHFMKKRSSGIISLLDEESNFLNATDLTFASKLKQYLNAHNCFKGDRDGAFSVHHSCGEVLYDSGGFLEKNRDQLQVYIIQLLSPCTSRLPQLFASLLLKESQLACQQQSAATKFKDQLFKLMRHLESTTPHFIYCRKPNSKQLLGEFQKDLVLMQLRCCGVLAGVRISRSGYPTRMAYQEFTRRYGFLLPENNVCQDPLTTSVAILQQFDILPEMYQVGFMKLYFRAGQIGALEEVRKQACQGSLEVQKCFRSHRPLRNFIEVKQGVIKLQSYVRGEISRKAYGLLKLKKQVVTKTLDEQVMAVLQVQSVIRGWLVRRHLSCLHNVNKWKMWKKDSIVEDLPPDLLPSGAEELKRQVLMAEVTLGQKENEIEVLRTQVQQFEVRWSEYDGKMKSMEEMWQTQISSLQMNLAAEKKSLNSDNTLDQSMGIQNPGGDIPIKSYNNGVEARACREMNGELNAISPLVEEFDLRKKQFEDEALAIVEGKSGQSHSVNPVEEVQKLKQRFQAWKKGYKVQLNEAKTKAHKLGLAEVEKNRRKWWRRACIMF